MSSEAEVYVLVPYVLPVSMLALELSEWTRCVLVVFPLWAQEKSWTIRPKVTYINRHQFERKTRKSPAVGICLAGYEPRKEDHVCYANNRSDF